MPARDSVTLFGISIFAALAAVVALILAAIALHIAPVSNGNGSSGGGSCVVPPFPETLPLPVVDLNGTHCDDGNVCTQDLYYHYSSNTSTNELDYCENKARPSGSPCTTQCFVPGASSGSCRVKDASCQLADHTECRGYCPPTGPSGSIVWTSSSCTALFQRSLFFFNGTDILSRTLADANLCLADQCIRAMLGPQMEIGPAYGFISTSFGNGFASCKDLLDPAVATVSCIEATTTTLVSQAYTDYMNNLIYGNTNLAIDWPMRLCTFRYACGQWNQTMLNDPAYQSASIASANPAVAAAASALPADLGFPAHPAVRDAMADVVATLSQQFAATHGDEARAVAAAHGIIPVATK